MNIAAQRHFQALTGRRPLLTSAASCLLTLCFIHVAHAQVVPVPGTVRAVRDEQTKPRSVVFILSDDHRYDAMSFMGHPFAKTPHMDAMAKHGAHLKNAFVTTSLCSPSRASILTGLYTFRHRVIDNQRAVPDGTLFFPQYLQQAGYRTGFIGKWHMGHANDEPRPGFDEWFSFKGQGHYYPPGDKYTINDNGRRVPQDGYITTLLTKKAIEFLEQQKDRDEPFFLYLSHKAVHGPFTPEPKYQGSLASGQFDLPASGQPLSGNQRNRPRWLLDQRNSWHGMDFPLHTATSIEKFYKSYCEALRSVDDSIGAVMAQLKAMGIHDDTLVIYMGDNGYMFGEHGLIDKRVAYETSSRVPMLMQCPAIIEGGSVIEQVVANIDIAPTVMQAMGLKKPPHMDGQSFLPLARVSPAQRRTIPWRDYFLYVYYWEQNYPQTPTHFSLRGEQYKYTTYYGLWDTDELFDIRTDPEEQHNLIHNPEFAGTKERMQDRLYAMMEELGGMEIPLNPPRGRQQNKRLRDRGGVKAADFPTALIVDEPLRKELNVPARDHRSGAKTDVNPNAGTANAPSRGRTAATRKNISLAKIDGRHWLVNSDGKPFFAHGITHAGTVRAKFDLQKFSAACKEVGFNSYGYGCPDGLRSDMPYLESWNHLVPISMYRGDGTHNYCDIFDPQEQARLERGVKASCARSKDNPNCIGYAWTDLATWPLKNQVDKSWVDFMRELPEDAPGHQAYQKFLTTWQGNDAKERDQAFLRLIAREYFRVIGTANRKYDPHHLIFGDRLSFYTYDEDVLKEMLPWIDAIAFQPHFWRTFPKQQFDEMYQLSGKPILLCDFAIRFKDGDKDVRMWKMEEDSTAAGQSYADYVTAALDSEYIIGVFWCNPVDTPKGFRKTGVKQGFFGENLSERPGLHEAVRKLNAYRDEITPGSILP